MTEQVKSALERHSLEFKERVPMRDYTTFRVGGPADFFLEPASVQELSLALRIFSDADMPWLVLGNGSNLLVRDGGIRGAVIHLGRQFSLIRSEGNRLYSQAGARLSALCSFALSAGLTGLEFAGGIPGTVGGGVFMNAGAYGGELGEWIQKVWALDREFRPVVLPRDELEMSYRHSLFMEQPFLITDCEFSLKTGDTEDAKMQLKEYNRRRREKQPLEYPSAGSTFRRPPGYFAGALIEEAGLKGYQIGGAQVSEKHAGFIINTGNASAKDIIALISYVRETVIRQSGVMLQSEVRIVGEEI